jgi:hypothetical protein
LQIVALQETPPGAYIPVGELPFGKQVYEGDPK